MADERLSLRERVLANVARARRTDPETSHAAAASITAEGFDSPALHHLSPSTTTSMNYDENIYAEVVFDGDETHAPARMGTPTGDQLQGTTLERLIELCGRVCYDSLGKGRSSHAYHAHILEVGHGSVWEHANFTVEFIDQHGRDLGRELFPIFLNRPGVWVEHHDPQVVRATFNMRSAIEWDAWAGGHNLGPIKSLEAFVRAAIFDCANHLAPTLFGATLLLPDKDDVPTDSGVRYKLVTPKYPEEKWVSILLGGSRGMSHEQVRHKWRTAISQRSTRYVDESSSPWVQHPLDAHYYQGVTPSEDSQGVLKVARTTYDSAVRDLQGFLELRGVGKITARKQARGAARGFLGNALHTELIFSASVAQWRRMIDQRCSRFADAEIRVLYGHVVRALQNSKWGTDFADIQLVPSPDGIGEVAEPRQGVCS